MVWLGTSCGSIFYQDRYRDYCAIVNNSDIGPTVEALVTVNTRGAYWQVDWLHLYRNGIYLSGVSSTAPTGWMAGSTGSFSTKWYSLCQRGGNFQARVRLRFKPSAADSIGPSWWVKKASGNPYVASEC